MRGFRWVLAAALALIVVGVVASLGWSDDDTPNRQAARVAPTTSTSVRTEVLGAVVDQTTTTAAPAPSTTVTTATGVTTTTVGTAGRVWGYSYPSQPNDETTVTLSQGATTVAKAKTDGNGYFEFTKVASGNYELSRTTVSSSCSTTTTSGEQPTCTMASSTSKGPEFTLSPGGEVRADVF
jgi:hypothetical protein